MLRSTRRVFTSVKAFSEKSFVRENKKSQASIRNRHDPETEEKKGVIVTEEERKIKTIDKCDVGN